MPNWPITLNAITEGAIIKASDLESNFTKLKNASNSMHERFATLSYNGIVDVKYPNFKPYSDAVYPFVSARTLGLITTDGAMDRFLGSTEDNLSRQPVQDVDGYRVFGVFAVPAWVQAIRVRDVTILNNSTFPESDDYDAVADHATPLEIGVRHITAYTSWDQNATSAPGTLITLKTYTVTVGTTNVFGYTNSNETSPLIQTHSPNVLVLGGQYIVIYGRGGLNFTMNNDGELGETHFNFHVNITCDAMVPIP